MDRVDENAFGAHIDDICVSLFGGIVKRCLSVAVFGIDIRPTGQKVLQTQDMLSNSKTRMSSTHLDCLQFSVARCLVKWCHHVC